MGATLLITQIGLAAVGTTIWVGLLPREERTYEVGSPEEQSIKLRRAAAPVCGWSAIGVYVFGFLDAQRQWRVERPPGVAADVPIGFRVHGRL
jgi:hypothetical protein